MAQNFNTKTQQVQGTNNYLQQYILGADEDGFNLGTEILYEPQDLASQAKYTTSSVFLADYAKDYSNSAFLLTDELLAEAELELCPP